MIPTLLVTILIEWIVVVLFCTFTKKPVGVLLFASVPVNLLTQTLLWFWLGIFHQFYIPALLIAEASIWLIESLLMVGLSNGQLNHKGAFALSFYMNAASFGVGLFLPI